MSEFVILSDSSCDLTLDVANELGVRIIPFYVSFDGNNYIKEKEDIPVQDFYQQLIDNPNVFPKTSMPTSEDYIKEYEKAYNEKKAVICLTLTKKFSGSWNSAEMGKKMFLEEHPDARIEVVDSTLISCSQGLLIREILRMQENGLTLDEILPIVDKIKTTGRCYFTINGLSYLQHGGRVGKLTAIVGNLLKINPLIIHKNGEIQSSVIAISRKRALVKILEKFKQTLNKYNLNINDYIFEVGYGHSIEEAYEFKNKFESMFNVKVEYMNQIGATISVHTGPYPIGIAFIKKYDVE